jgi:hypothetical protein
MDRDRTSGNGDERRSTGGRAEHPATITRARGFFERAVERVRNAAQHLVHPGHRGHREQREQRERDYERRFSSNLGGGYDMRDEDGTVHDYLLRWGEDRDRARGYGGYGGSQYMGQYDRREYERDREHARRNRYDRIRGRRW